MGIESNKNTSLRINICFDKKLYPYIYIYIFKIMIPTHTSELSVLIICTGILINASHIYIYIYDYQEYFIYQIPIALSSNYYIYLRKWLKNKSKLFIEGIFHDFSHVENYFTQVLRWVWCVAAMIFYFTLCNHFKLLSIIYESITWSNLRLCHIYMILFVWNNSIKCKSLLNPRGSFFIQRVEIFTA